MMFDIKNFYQECNSGESVDPREAYQYIRTFDTIILWGGSYLGAAVGRDLLAQSIQITKYWDVRKEELSTVNDIPVERPFETDYDCNKTLVIFCIGNHTIQKSLMDQVDARGYTQIRGDILYSGTICPFKNGMSLTSKGCWENMECRALVCQRATSIIQHQNQEHKPGERIDFTYIAYIVNNVCNLGCKYCFQYINNYPSNLKSNVPIDILKRDVDIFMNTIDSTGSITVMGGETFMHPNLGEFIEHLCKHKNFGFISVASNGLYPISAHTLEKFTDERVAVNFGSYLHVATERQKETYYKNVELVKSFGITCTESVKLPQWTIPSTLYKLDVDEEYKRNRKQKCVMPPRDLQVKSGKVHVCDMSLALHNMGLENYPRDYMDLTIPRSLEESRIELRRLVDEPFYESCGHCNSYGANGGEGGTQGKWNIFSQEEK